MKPPGVSGDSEVPLGHGRLVPLASCQPSLHRARLDDEAERYACTRGSGEARAGCAAGQGRFTLTDVESGPAAWDEAAVRLAGDGMAASDIRALDTAIAMLRRAVRAATGEQSRYLSHLGSTLSYRHQLTG